MQAFFNGLSGLLTFSQGLKNVSNNVSNMNTPGFRGSDTFYRSVNGEGEQGLGADVAGTSLRTTQGEIRQTGNDTDAAIVGNGFFVLKSEEGDYFYSRAGQFKLSNDGFLVESVTGYKVMAVNAAGGLDEISVADFKVVPPKPTSRIEFSGNLVSGSSTHSVSSVNVVDKTGKKVVLTVDFTSNSTVTPNSWQVKVKNSTGVEVGSGELRFDLSGSPMAGFNTISILMTSNGQTQDIVLDFGDPGTFNAATQFSGANSTLGVSKVDGSVLAGMTGFEFDESGAMKFAYSSGEKVDGQQLALASFSDVSLLKHVNGSLYQSPDAMKPDIGKANDGVFGKIQGGAVELSNIDLAQEFGDILIIQRGYQASSRVMTVANELLEQLYGGRSKGG